MTPAPVDLGAVRRARALDELATLARAGVDVHTLLTHEGSHMSGETPFNLRMPQEFYDRADALVERLRGSPAAAAAGARWGRAAVIRMAVAHGIAALEAEADAARDGAGGSRG